MLLPFSPRQLKQLHAYDPEIGGQIDSEAKAFYEKFPPTMSDRKLAYDIASKKKKGTLLNPASVDESAWASGSRVVYTAEYMTVVRASGDETDYKNCVIPTVGDKTARPGLYQLVAILSTFFKYSGASKKIDLVTQMATIEEAWGVSASVLKPSGLIPLKQMFVDFVVSSALWEGYQDHQRSSLTGPRWICFLATLFDTCNWDDYFAFHTYIAYDFLKIYRATGGPQNRRYVPILVRDNTGADVPFVSASSLIVLNKERENGLPVEAKTGCDKVRQLLKRDPVVLRGPFPTAHQFVDSKAGTFEKAHKAYAKGNTLRGGDDSGLNVFSSAIGFSGLPTPLARHQILVTSVAGWLLSQVDELDIYCPSIGIIPILHSSLLAVKQMRVNSCSWRFITSFTDSTKVDPLYSDYVLTSFRQGAHRLWVSDKVMPSAKKASDLLLKSSDNMRQIVAEGVSFTFFGPLFGAAPWAQGRFVHRFGLPSNFWGFCGTISDLSLLGMVGENVSELLPIVRPLDKVPTDGEWYEIVVRANMNRNAVFLRLGRQYSPISNILIPPSKGVKFATRGTDLAYAEQGDNDNFYDSGDDSEDGDAEYVPEEGTDEFERSEEEFEDVEPGEQYLQETTAANTAANTHIQAVTTGGETHVATTTPAILPSPSFVRVVKSVKFDDGAQPSPTILVPVGATPSSLVPVVPVSVRPQEAYAGSSTATTPSPVPVQGIPGDDVERRAVRRRPVEPAGPAPPEKEGKKKAKPKSKQPQDGTAVIDGDLGVFEAKEFTS